MYQRTNRLRTGTLVVLLAGVAVAGLNLWLSKAIAERQETYMPVVIEDDFDTIMKKDASDKPAMKARQQKLLENRYDLRNDASDVKMSGGRKAVQQGVRVKLPDGVSWDQLAGMKPAEIKDKDLFPMGFRPLPHARGIKGDESNISRCRAC